MNRKILVTGARGFIGSHCLPILIKKGFKIHAVSRASVPANTPQINWHQANLLDEQQVADLIKRVEPTHLLHLAWHTKHGEYAMAQQNFLWLDASLKLIDFFKKSGGCRAVIAGSIAEILSKSNYSISKLKLKSALETDFRGLSSAWGRISYVFGPHEPPEKLISATVKRLSMGERPLIVPRNPAHDFVYVRNVADKLAVLEDSNETGTINICSKRLTSVESIVSLVERAFLGDVRSKLTPLGREIFETVEYLKATS